MKFELFVALRYLKAKRKQAAISIITIISILGVTAGVTALIVALAISRGFREDLQSKLLRGTSHINILPVDVKEGIANYAELVVEDQDGQRNSQRDAGSLQRRADQRGSPEGIMLKGMAVDDPEFLTEGFFDVLQGSAADLLRLRRSRSRSHRAWARKMAKQLGTVVGDFVPSSYGRRRPLPCW